MKYKNIREEELKNKVGADWFADFDTTEILGNIDFTVFPKQDNIFGRTPFALGGSQNRQLRYSYYVCPIDFDHW